MYRITGNTSNETELNEASRFSGTLARDIHIRNQNNQAEVVKESAPSTYAVNDTVKTNGSLALAGNDNKKISFNENAEVVANYSKSSSNSSSSDSDSSSSDGEEDNSTAL